MAVHGLKIVNKFVSKFWYVELRVGQALSEARCEPVGHETRKKSANTGLVGGGA